MNKILDIDENTLKEKLIRREIEYSPIIAKKLFKMAKFTTDNWLIVGIIMYLGEMNELGTKYLIELLTKSDQSTQKRVSNYLLAIVVDHLDPQHYTELPDKVIETAREVFDQYFEWKAVKIDVRPYFSYRWVEKENLDTN